jgi:hypothetical protein
VRVYNRDKETNFKTEAIVKNNKQGVSAGMDKIYQSKIKEENISRYREEGRFYE